MSRVRVPSVTPTRGSGAVRRGAYTAERDRASSSTAEQRTLNPQVLGSKPRGRTAKAPGRWWWVNVMRRGSPLHAHWSWVRYPLNYPWDYPLWGLSWGRG